MRRTFSLFQILLFSFGALAASPDFITYEGALTDTSGAAVDLSGQTVEFEITGPAPASCVIYKESFVSAATDGFISHKVGSVTVGSEGNFNSALFNSAATEIASLGGDCTVGASDQRSLRVSVPGKSISAQILLSSVPYALEATAVGGFQASSLLRVSSGTVPAFTANQISELTSLLGGTSTQYVKPSAASFTSAPTYSGVPASASELVNKAYVDSKVSAGTISGSVELNTTGNVTTSATLSSSHLNTVSLSSSSASINTLKLFDGVTNHVQLTASGLAGSYSLTMPVSAGNTGQVLTSDGTGRLTWVNPSAGGSVTNVSSTNSYLTVTNPTSTPALTLNVGTAANTVAAGDDERIAGALQRAGGTMTGSLFMSGKNISGVGSLILGNSTGTVNLRPSTGNYTLTLPGSAGAGGQVLMTDTSGSLSWASVSSGTTGFNQGGNAFGAAASLGTDDSNSLNFETANATRMTITSTGSIGIGTASPERIFHVKSGVSSMFEREMSLTDQLLTAATLQATSTGAGTEGFGSALLFQIKDNTNPATMIAAIGAHRDASAFGNGILSFRTSTAGSPTERMRINASGNVGIGTSDPNRLLHVAGPMRLTASALPASPAAGDLAIDSGSNNTLKWYNGTSWVSAGGGGGGAPVNAFLQGGNNFGTAATLGTTDNNSLNFATYGTDRMTVTATGNIGIGTANPEFQLSLGGDGGIIATGSHGLGPNLTTGGYGSRLIWYPQKSAFRAGFVSSNQWDDANIGDYSIAMGSNAKATKLNSVAFGFNSLADGQWSTAMGANTKALGDYSTAFGEATEAFGGYSTALGSNTKANGGYSTAMGFSSNANGEHSIVMGESLVANSRNEIVLGVNNFPLAGTSGGWVATDPLFVIGNGPNNWTQSNAVTILKNGNVGIGTTIPNRLLDVAGPIRLAASALPSIPQVGDLVIDSMADNSLKWYNGTSWVTAGGSSGGPANAFIQDGNAFSTPAALGTTDPFGLSFKTNNSSRMTITSSGQIGIGTTSPTARFEVADEISPVTDGIHFGTKSSVKFTPPVYGSNIYSAAVGAIMELPSANSQRISGVAAVYGQTISSVPSFLRVDSLNGVKGEVKITDGDVKEAMGIAGSIEHGSSTPLQKGYGGLFRVEQSSGVINEASGVHVENVQASGVAYGVSVGTLSSVNKWSFYAMDSNAPSYFAGNVGIGTTSTTSALSVGGAISLERVGTQSPSTGNDAKIYFDMGTGKVKISEAGGPFNQLYNPPGGFTSNIQFNNNGQFEGTNNLVWDQLNGRLGVNTSAPAEAVDIIGSVKADGYITSSDRRLKYNIENVDGLNLIRKMRAVKYQRYSNHRSEYGVIAQEVEEIDPDLVSTDPVSGYKAVNYQGFISPLIDAVQELDRQCNARSSQLERKVKSLEVENLKMKSELESMKSEMSEIKRMLEKISREASSK